MNVLIFRRSAVVSTELHDPLFPLHRKLLQPPSWYGLGLFNYTQLHWFYVVKLWYDFEWRIRKDV